MFQAIKSVLLIFIKIMNNSSLLNRDEFEICLANKYYHTNNCLHFNANLQYEFQLHHTTCSYSGEKDLFTLNICPDSHFGPWTDTHEI